MSEQSYPGGGTTVLRLSLTDRELLTAGLPAPAEARAVRDESFSDPAAGATLAVLRLPSSASDSDPETRLLIEYSGRGGETSLAYRNGKASFKMTDLSGRGEQPAAGAIPFRPWQFQTFRIELPR